MRVVSFGAGVNSTAMILGMYERGERPDLILFADTGGEKPETYQHINVIQQWCRRHDMPDITVISYNSPKHSTLEEECWNNETLPSKAFGFSGCSVKWKRQPMDKYLLMHSSCQKVWEQGQKVQRLIGIHLGEYRRGKIADDQRYTYRYPLREWGWKQRDCEDAIKRHGFKRPVKSACFFCPAMKKFEVLWLAYEHPDLFHRAIEMEEQAIEAGRLETVKGLGRNWSWAELVESDRAQLHMFRDLQVPLCDACFDGE